MESAKRILLLLACALATAGCNVALGPGYTVKKQQLEARWTGTPELAVRGNYRLQNAGNVPLDYLDVTLPPDSRRSGLQISLDGSPVATQPADALAPAGTVRIPISPALPLKKKCDLVIEYRLAGSVGDVSATPSFYLETRGWYPALREREGLFGSGGEPPEKWDLRVTVPRDFLVHASGQQKGRKRRNDLVEHRFRQRTGKDFDPFVVAGRYQEQKAPSAGAEVILWTFQPPPESAIRDFGHWVGQTAQQYQTTFGTLGEDTRILLIEPPPGIASAPGERKGPFPGGTFLLASEYTPVSGEDSDFWVRLDERLALIWFHHGITPVPDARLLFEEGLPRYAATIAAEAHNEISNRAALASNRLAFYEDLGGSDHEPHFFLNSPDTSRERVRYAAAKAPLFFLALEDRYGKEAIRNALARLVESLRGRLFNTNDLRVAIQLETGEDPAEFFRQWLNQPGIPEDFRKRYEKQGPGSR